MDSNGLTLVVPLKTSCARPAKQDLAHVPAFTGEDFPLDQIVMYLVFSIFDTALVTPC